MATVAQQLRAAREAQKLTVYQVADATKIKTEHVRALDEGNYKVFAAPVYIRGFIRTYATYLKLPVPQIMAALDEELAQTKEFSGPPSLSAQQPGLLDSIMFHLSRLNWRLILLVGGTLIVIISVTSGYLLWRTQRAKDPLAELGPGIYPAKPPQSGDTLPLPTPTAPARK